MSLCRFSPDSDVYVYSTGDDVYTCCGCRLGQDTNFSRQGMLRHLKLHIANGDQVPDYAIKTLEGNYES